jgi:hypothetical protein
VRRRKEQEGLEGHRVTQTFRADEYPLNPGTVGIEKRCSVQRLKRQMSAPRAPFFCWLPISSEALIDYHRQGRVFAFRRVIHFKKS